MSRPPAPLGDGLLELHTEAIMELSEALSAIQPVINSKTQNPKVLALALQRAKEAMAHTVATIQAAEAIRKEESPRSIAAKIREAKKRKPQ